MSKNLTFNRIAPRAHRTSLTVTQLKQNPHFLTAALLALTMCLAGCSGNYTWSDSDYRPLGEPYPVKRGK